jgi:hypothetical protein
LIRRVVYGELQVSSAAASPAQAIATAAASVVHLRSVELMATSLVMERSKTRDR